MRQNHSLDFPDDLSAFRASQDNHSGIVEGAGNYAWTLRFVKDTDAILQMHAGMITLDVRDAKSDQGSLAVTQDHTIGQVHSSDDTAGFRRWREIRLRSALFGLRLTGWSDV